MEPRWWPKAWCWDTLVVLDLADGPGSTKLFAAQEDLISFGSLLSPLPLLGWYASLLRRAAALAISTAVALSGAAYRSAVGAYKAAIAAAGGSDAGPPPRKAPERRRRRVDVQALTMAGS